MGVFAAAVDDVLALALAEQYRLARTQHDGKAIRGRGQIPVRPLPA